MILPLAIALAATPSLADEVSDLRIGCAEAIALYNKRDEAPFLAMQKTSASEALRAGYCRGVVKEYLRTARPCLYGRNVVSNWREMARRLAKDESGSAATVDEMLRSARCGH